MKSDKYLLTIYGNLLLKLYFIIYKKIEHKAILNIF